MGQHRGTATHRQPSSDTTLQKPGFTQGNQAYRYNLSQDTGTGRRWNNHHRIHRIILTKGGCTHKTPEPPKNRGVLSRNTHGWTENPRRPRITTSGRTKEERGIEGTNGHSKTQPRCRTQLRNKAKRSRHKEVVHRLNPTKTEEISPQRGCTPTKLNQDRKDPARKRLCAC